MKKYAQLSLFKAPRKGTKRWWIETKKVYGGSLNYRKNKRPFDENKLNHVVFKARLGRGIWFTKSQKSIEKILKASSQRYKLNLKSFAINRDHIHVLIWGGDSSSHSNFLRFFSAEMGRKYGQVFKRFGLIKRRSLWTHRPFSRPVSWGKRSLDIIFNYIEKNRNEALGFIPYTPRQHQLTRFLEKWSEYYLGASAQSG